LSRFALPAFAKINLGLTILGKRPDGYHELRTVYQTISLADRLTFDDAAKGFTLRVRGAELATGEGNLVTRAARLFARRARRRLAVEIRLEKRIPMGAGLGGGSSDAAVTLVGLNRLHGSPLAPEALMELAAGLGSDVPFFLRGGTVLGLGRGEILRPLRDLDEAPVLLLVPNFGISTPEAFRRVDRILTPKRGQISIYRFSQQRVRASREPSFQPNDLERAVAPIYPRLRECLGRLRRSGACAVAMTGSGSAVFALFAGQEQAARAFRSLRVRTAETAWLGRTIGRDEYSARVRC
jgi:4-diphosphocytidyl-2-C-methyl-D-erythritol kinase